MKRVTPLLSVGETSLVPYEVSRISCGYLRDLVIPIRRCYHLGDVELRMRIITTTSVWIVRGTFVVVGTLRNSRRAAIGEFSTRFAADRCRVHAPL